MPLQHQEVLFKPLVHNACVTKATLVSSRFYSDHDVNCNYMQDAS
jgi:hypothetical protein